MATTRGYLLIELESSDGRRGRFLAPILAAITDADAMEVYQVTAENRPTMVLEQIIANHVQVGALEDCEWRFSSWRRVSEQERRADYPELIVPPFPKPRRRGKGSPSQR